MCMGGCVSMVGVDYTEPQSVDRIVGAIENLDVDVITAFKHHDQDLRAEVELVNKNIKFLLASIGVLIAAVVLWPRR